MCCVGVYKRLVAFLISSYIQDQLAPQVIYVDSGSTLFLRLICDVVEPKSEQLIFLMKIKSTLIECCKW